MTDRDEAAPKRAESDAASLLADLARAPQAVDGVAETAGHMAAAAAVGPHRPAASRAAVVDERAVVVNITQPLPHVTRAPNDADTIEDLPRPLQYSTVPSLRAQSKRRWYVGCAIVAAVALGVGGGASLFAPRRAVSDFAPTGTVSAPAAPKASEAPPAVSVVSVGNIEEPPSAPSSRPRPLDTGRPSPLRSASPATAAKAATSSEAPPRPSPPPPQTSAGDFPWRQ
ncbi:MAG: hypothetical protein KF819_33835 [Labilithrix sp.]|nr:hypothetical protein [Labilithrix sp.]